MRLKGPGFRRCVWRERHKAVAVEAVQTGGRAFAGNGPGETLCRAKRFCM
jgi:hypothetical protein